MQKKKLLVKDNSNGEIIKGDFIIDEHGIWKVEFGSANSVSDPTKYWNGYAHLMRGDYTITLEDI